LGSPLLASPFGAKIKNSNLRLKSAGEPSHPPAGEAGWASQQRHFPTGGVRSKKFEQISPKICRAGGPACRQAGFPPDPPSARLRKRPFRIEKLPKNLKKYRLELHFGPKAGFPHF